MVATNVEFISMTQMLSDLRLRLRDGGDSRYSLPEKYAALQDSARSLHGRYGVPSVYTSLSFTVSVYDYGIPHYIGPNITRIERKYIGGIQATGNSYVATPWRNIQWWDLRTTPQTNFLYIDQSEIPLDTRIWYTEHISGLPPAEATLAQAVSPTQATIPINAAVSSMGIQDYQSHGYLEMREGSKREVMFYETVSDTSFMSVTRNISGVAASFNSGVIVSPVVAMPLGRIGYTWMLNDARAQLMEIRLQDTAVGDRGDVIWLTRWHNQRDEELRKVLDSGTREPATIMVGSRGRFLGSQGRRRGSRRGPRRDDR